MIKIFKAFTILLAFVTVLCYTSKAQKTAFEMAEQMSRGINLGNVFDAEKYEGAWAPVAHEADFDGYKQAGFTAIRIPITWGAYLAKDDKTPRLALEKPYKINKQFLDRIDSVINWSVDRELVTVINAHHEKWLKGKDTFDDNKDRFYALWEQLSKHYKDQPDLLVFEILNEPHHENEKGEQDGMTQEQVDEINKKVLAIIRKHNPTRKVIYSGGSWGGLYNLSQTVVPDSTDKYLIAGYHSYGPWSYAGEGQGSWGTEKDKASMEEEFDGLVEYRKKYNVPVYIGEFGAQHKCEYNSRMQHYAYYVENIHKNNAPSTAWDDNGFLFKVYDRNTHVWDDSKDIIINYTDNSPSNLRLDINDGNVVKITWKNRLDGEKVVIERRVGRIGAFESLVSIDFSDEYIDETPKKLQTTYYYRVRVLASEKELVSYPQRIYIP